MLVLLKKIFLGITLRERLLLTGFLWVGVLIWLMTNLSSWRQTYDSLTLSSSKLENQKGIIDQEPLVDSKLNTAKAEVDPTKTYSSSRLVEELEFITGLVKAESEIKNFPYKTSKVNTEKKNIYNVHTLRVSITEARLADLLHFDKLLQERSRYIVLSKVTLGSRINDYRNCSADYELSSFELLEESQEVPVTTPKRNR